MADLVNETHYKLRELIMCMAMKSHSKEIVLSMLLGLQGRVEDAIKKVERMADE